jgi:hypothetical protein
VGEILATEDHQERAELIASHLQRLEAQLDRTRAAVTSLRQLLRPDVVWFNLVYSSFATAKHPVAAFAGLCAPALTRSMGYFTHVTLHHILENVDFVGAGIKQEGLFRLGGEMATRALLRANSVSVLLSGYRRTLVAKYAAQNVLLGTHGTFAACPVPPDFSLRGNPDQRILAIGHWGTYKRPPRDAWLSRNWNKPD